MSYSTINGMRSTRFPLQGDCGCGCGGRGDCKPRLGQDTSTQQLVQGAGAGGLLLILGFTALLIAGASGGRRRST
jgi:hypothetical protein